VGVAESRGKGKKRLGKWAVCRNSFCNVGSNRGEGGGKSKDGRGKMRNITVDHELMRRESLVRGEGHESLLEERMGKWLMEVGKKKIRASDPDKDFGCRSLRISNGGRSRSGPRPLKEEKKGGGLIECKVCSKDSFCPLPGTKFRLGCGSMVRCGKKGG